MGKHTAAAPLRCRAAVRLSESGLKTPAGGEQARHTVQFLHAKGFRNSDIERVTGLRHHFVRTWAKRSDVRARGPRGPAPLISSAQGAELAKQVVKKRFMSTPKLQSKLLNPKTGNMPCRNTIRKAIRKAGAISKRVRRSCRLSPEDKIFRKEWCEARRGEDWKGWVFSDEKVWVADGVQGNERMWVMRDDPCPDELYIPKRAKPPSLHAWAAISYTGRSTLHIFEHTVDSIEYIYCLDSALVPALYDPEFLGLRKSKKYVFQQDGARPHTANLTQGWLKKLPKHVRGLPKEEWPARSPDLNLIEQLWAILNNKVIEKLPYSRDDLKEVLKQEWWAIDQQVIRNLYNGMPNRVEQCIAKEGGRFRR